MKNAHYPSNEEKVFWGFVEWFRFWLEFDGLELNRLQCKSFGKLGSGSVRRIARKYSVNRGIRAAAKNVPDDYPARWLADVINEFDYSKHSSLKEKADFCIDIAKAAACKNINVTHGRQVSAVTKLLWFRCQEEWTVYDKHASSAVGLRDNDTLVRMKKYYKILSCRGFLEYARDVDETLEREEFQFQYGCRVIDAFLMLNSRENNNEEKTFPERTIENCKLFLDCLPVTFREHIISVGMKIPRGMENLLGK